MATGENKTLPSRDWLSQSGRLLTFDVHFLDLRPCQLAHSAAWNGQE